MDTESKKEIKNLVEEVSRFFFFSGLSFTCLGIAIAEILSESALSLHCTQIAKLAFILLTIWLSFIISYENLLEWLRNKDTK